MFSMPRHISLSIVALAATLGLSSLVGVSSSQAAPVVSTATARNLPPLTFQNLALRSFSNVPISGRHVSTLLPPTHVDEFNVVGLTWTGEMADSTQLQVKIREAGKWTSWNTLTFTSEHGPDGDTREAAKVLNGTDPLLALASDAISVRAITNSSSLPKDMHLVITGSQPTSEDQMMMNAVNQAATFPSYADSPQGARVLRPNIVTRAQWMGSYASTYETSAYRDEDPEMGTGIIAGFVHHTVTTNSYAKSGGRDAAYQMRSLFLFFVRGRHYKDMGYSFLVDKYGTIYEGRSGCPVPNGTNADIIAACDGPTMPAIGAHTAGMNRNTFAISAIGGYHLVRPHSAMVNSIAKLMAWRIAPYGLDPQVKTVIPMYSDPKRYSQFKNGQFAYKYTISGHRDVGRTVCPGKYLYPYMSSIRSKIAALLVPTIKHASVNPLALLPTDTSPVHIAADVPAHSTWSVSVISVSTQVELERYSGVTQETAGTISEDWNHLDTSDPQVTDKLLDAGAYRIVISETVNGQEQPAVTSLVYVGTVPDAVTNIINSPLFDDTHPTSRVSKATWVSWDAVTNSTPVTYKYWLWSASTNKWSAWQWTRTETQVGLRGLKLNNRYKIQVLATNAHGDSEPLEYEFSVTQ